VSVGNATTNKAYDQRSAAETKRGTARKRVWRGHGWTRLAKPMRQDVGAAVSPPDTTATLSVSSARWSQQKTSEQARCS
jgi:hypothetical protein